MHTYAFSFRRLDQGLLAIQRQLLKPLAITPQRVELLIAMANLGHEEPKFMFQSEIRRALGVSRTTVSRMLTGLEADGYVRRTVSIIDTRQRLVELTPKARELFFHVERIACRFRFTLMLVLAQWKNELAILPKLHIQLDRALFRYPKILRPSRIKKIPECVTEFVRNGHEWSFPRSAQRLRDGGPSDKEIARRIAEFRRSCA